MRQDHYKIGLISLRNNPKTAANFVWLRNKGNKEISIHIYRSQINGNDKLYRKFPNLKRKKREDNPKLVPLRVRIILQNYFNFAKK